MYRIFMFFFWQFKSLFFSVIWFSKCFLWAAFSDCFFSESLIRLLIFEFKSFIVSTCSMPDYFKCLITDAVSMFLFKISKALLRFFFRVSKSSHLSLRLRVSICVLTFSWMWMSLHGVDWDDDHNLVNDFLSVIWTE